ncbi:MAG: glycosyltransferase, partial [Flavobacterium sp.]|nr:glycosyltransferase [Flavobacterium sp.]
IFPSKLETWGLPISEAKFFDKPMLLANLPYAKETVGDYENVSFFDVNEPKELADLITNFVNKTIVFEGNEAAINSENKLNSWFELFDYITKP